MRSHLLTIYRILLILYLSLSVSAQVQGQNSGTKIRILIVKTRDIPFYDPVIKGFTNGLKSRGYRTGERVELQVIALSGKEEADTRKLREQIAKKPSLLLTLGTDATRLVAEIKPAIPVLFSMVIDPVALGVVKTLEAPGGGFTGTTLLAPPGKQLEALQQALPKIKKVGVLYTDKDPSSLTFLGEARQEAQRLNLQILATPVKEGQKTQEALAKMEGIPDAFWLIPDPASTGAMALKETLIYTKAAKIPVLGASSGTVRAGALMALSAHLEDLGDSTAEMAIHILEGTDTPAKMRVRGPRKTLLSVNLLAARSLSITLPKTVLQLADEVIDSLTEENEP